MPETTLPAQPLCVALGDTLYRVERPFGAFERGTALVSDVACDSRGHVFVLLRQDPLVDRPAPAVIELDPEGGYVGAIGQGIIADGHMLAIDQAGRLFVVDRDAHQIVVLDQSGALLSTIGERHRPGRPFAHPSAVAFGPDGTIYVADGYGASRIHRFDAEGTLLGSWGSPGKATGQFTTPHGLWVLADGRVLVADRENDRVQSFSAAGEWLATWTDFPRPMDIWSDPEGAVYVTDQVPRLSRLSPEGVLTGRCRPVLNGAHGIAGDTAGRLYLAEVNPSRVTRLVPAGRA
jgi:peptidylglycine monooxygenase